MCGIVGEWRFDGEPVDRDQLIAARDRLRQRGPDDAGIHIEPGLGLGHRRLSIIDLSPAGRMPMTNETADVWAVFNGEIYNFVSLREQLEALGHRFRSHTDSEVIIHGYEQWGTGAIERFDGMFALAIWDRPRQRLILARDIAGEKPLYFNHDRSGVRFASTPRALVGGRHPAYVDADSVAAYLQLGYVPAPRSMFRGVEKVEPGTYVTFEPSRRPSTTRYWSLESAAQPHAHKDLSLEDATDQLHERLRTAVRTRLVSDVPLGAFLSGGIDSSLVVALMAESKPETVRTFTIGFNDPAFDESRHAAAIARHLGVSNTAQVISTNDVLREVAEMPRAFDEPLADPSVLPSLAVARLARQHVTVALSGDGADEAFAGYRYYAGVRAFERFARLVPHRVRTRMASGAKLLRNARATRAVQRIVADDTALFFARSGFHRGGTATTSLRHVLPTRAGMVEREIADYIRARHALRPVEAGMLWDATHTLPDAWLVKVDRTTMAMGLEARAPFLQRAVLEYAFSLPLDFRVRGLQKKIILRRILGRYLPAALYERPKQGFAPPLKSWFANELRDELHDRLAPARLRRFEALDGAGVGRILAEHFAGTSDHTQMLWALFCLDRWHDEYVEQVS